MLRASVRTCIGCRQRGPGTEMVRLFAEQNDVRVASRARGPGRGASVHPRAACVEAALRPGVLARAFKRPIDVSPDLAGRFHRLVTA